MLQKLIKRLDDAYTACATYYCEDPVQQASDDVGKKFYKCIQFIFDNEKLFNEFEERRKK